MTYQEAMGHLKSSPDARAVRIHSNGCRITYRWLNRLEWQASDGIWRPDAMGEAWLGMRPWRECLNATSSAGDSMTYLEAIEHLRSSPNARAARHSPTDRSHAAYRWSNGLEFHSSDGEWLSSTVEDSGLKVRAVWSKLSPVALLEPEPTPAANPKQAYGATKPNLALIPPVASLHMATALENGAEKYGPYNWRESKVSLMTYIAAIKRHIDNFQDGEENTKDTDVSNIGAVMASCAIILDAMSLGKAIDDRPPPGKSSETQEALQAKKIAKNSDAAGFGYGDDRR